MTSTMGPSAGRPLADARAGSAGWLLAGGIVLSALAILLFFNPAIGSVSVTLITGICLLIGGATMVVVSIVAGEHGGRVIGIVLGSLFALCGILLWSDVLAGTATLTAIVILWLVVDGAVGTVMSLVRRHPGWGLTLAGSLLALLLGLLLWSDWPSSAEWVLGVYAGLVLLLRGLSLVAAGLLLRRTA